MEEAWKIYFTDTFKSIMFLPTVYRMKSSKIQSKNINKIRHLIISLELVQFNNTDEHNNTSIIKKKN